MDHLTLRGLLSTVTLRGLLSTLTLRGLLPTLTLRGLFSKFGEIDFLTELQNVTLLICHTNFKKYTSFNLFILRFRSYLVLCRPCISQCIGLIEKALILIPVEQHM